MHAPVLHGETTTEALERWVGPHARWELGHQALVTDEMVVWICAPPEVELIDAEMVAWRAVRRYTTRRRGVDAFVPVPLRREPRAQLHLVGTATDGALGYLGPAHLSAYGRSAHGSHGEALFHLLDRLPRALWLRLGGFAAIRVEANGVREDVEAAAVRAAAADVLAASATGELCLRRWTGEALMLLFEPERAFVIELSGRGDVGSVACDPLNSGERRPVAFTLSNGQVDECRSRQPSRGIKRSTPSPAGGRRNRPSRSCGQTIRRPCDKSLVQRPSIASPVRTRGVVGVRESGSDEIAGMDP